MNDNNPREFGANDRVHEIFWITDRQEWRRLVGSGEFGTLGATLPRYVCDADSGKRSIFDADLVLNGLKPINWQVDCDNEDCVAVQTTLVHELGHLFGLDHPCLMCSTSIMSARAGFDLTHPVFDDMEGLRVLYPDSSTGGMGYPCSSDADCQDSSLCISRSSQKYCSKLCSNDEECELGTICAEQFGKKVCTFLDDETAGGRLEGDSCLRKPCSDPMICAGASDYNFFCFMPCYGQSNCKPHQTCVKLDEDVSLCVAIKKEGTQCDHKELCDDDLYCVFDNLSSGYCRRPCKATNLPESGCPAGEVCQRFFEGIEICVPPEYDLTLDEALDGFTHERGSNPSRIDSAKSQENNKSAGCNTAKNNENNPSIWVILLGLYLIKKWRPSLLFGQ